MKIKRSKIIRYYKNSKGIIYKIDKSGIYMTKTKVDFPVPKQNSTYFIGDFTTYPEIILLGNPVRPEKKVK